MIRRTFFKAAVTALVALREFIPLPSITAPLEAFLEGTSQEVQEELSPVLMALRKQNDDRVLALAKGAPLSDFWDPLPTPNEQAVRDAWIARQREMGNTYMTKVQRDAWEAQRRES